MKVDSISTSQPVMPVDGFSGNKTSDATPKKPQSGSSGIQTGAGREQLNEQDLKRVNRAVELLNETMAGYNTEVRFTPHKESGEYIIKIINITDNSVIREIPPKKVLDMVAYFKEMLGIIVDKFI